MTEFGHEFRGHYQEPFRSSTGIGSRLYTLWLRATYPFASIGRGTSFHYTAIVNRAMAARIALGKSVTISKDAWLNVIPEATNELNIIIDDGCCVSARTVISAKNCIHLETGVTIAPSVLIQDHSHFYESIHLPIRKQIATEGGRIRIEQGCRIGQGVAILCDRNELVLGQHSVVMPNSVVVRSAPPFSLLGGNPARVIGRLDSQAHAVEPACQPKEEEVPQTALKDRAVEPDQMLA